jgi:hypothetical protein
MPDTLCANVPPRIELTKSNLERYLSIALYQRKGLAACWAALRLGSGGALSPLSLSPLIGVPKSVLLCASVLWACSTDVERTAVPMSQEVLDSIGKWCKLFGRRGRRLFGVPVECLYGITERGCISQKMSTIDELRSIHEILTEDRKFSSDDEMEEFYATTFPDDIPDEWSLEDQEKSHGPGVLRTGERLGMAKLGRIWFQAESRFAWGFYEWTGEDKIIESSEPVDFRRIADDLNTSDDTIVTALLEPVRKLLIVE